MLLTGKEKQLVEEFFKAKVIQVNTVTPFSLASGKTAPVYFDHRRIFTDPALRGLLLDLWCEAILQRLGKAYKAEDVNIVGTATAGIAPAYAIAERIGARFLYIRSQPKDHGTGRMLEGMWEGSGNCVVVDDMVTTGESVLKAVKNVKEEGGNVLFASSITRHSLPSVAGFFAHEGVELLSLLATADAFDTAYGMNLLTSKEMRTLMSWLNESEANLSN